MLAIKVGKQYLDLDAKTSLSIQATTPLTDTDNVGRAFSYDFDLPDSPTNIAILGHPNRLEKAPQKNEEAKILLENLPYLKGKLSIMEVKKTIKTVFKNQDRNILDELDYDLSTFAQETINLYTNGPVDMVLTWSISVIRQNLIENQTNTCSIVINGQKFTVIVTDWRDFNHFYDWEPIYTQLANEINTFIGQNIATYQSSPAPSVAITYNQLLEMTEAKDMTSNYPFSLYEFEKKRIVAGIQALIENPDASFIFPMIHTPLAYPDNTEFKGNPYLNRQYQNLIVQNEWTNDKADFQNAFAPGVRLQYILQKIATRLKLTLDGDWWAEIEAKRLFFWTANTLDEFVEEDTPLSNPVEKRYLNRSKKSFTPGDFLPKMTAKDLFQKLSKTFGIYYKVEGKRLCLNKKQSLYKPKSHDWTPFLIPESLRFEPYSNQGLLLKYSFPTEATIPSDQLQPLQIGDADNSITYELDFVTLPMVSSFSYRVPEFWGAANADINSLLIFRPQVGYAHAFSDNKNEDGEIIPGAWSLNIQGDTGLYQKHLRNIAELQVAPNATALFDLPTEEITALQRGDFVRIHAHTINGTLRAIVKIIKIKPSVRDLGFAEVEMLRI